ncbi:hypothetical protein C0J52_09791 [Blattella germanica]|nr:hypothetical protein C0J52_09791 [Blattella germanica]
MSFYRDQSQIVARNVSYKITDVEKLCEEIFRIMEKEDWYQKFQHVNKLEQDYYDREAQFDNIIDPFVISLENEGDDENTARSQTPSDNEMEDFTPLDSN